MPWSPVPKFPAVIQHLKDKGMIKQVNLTDLRKSIILIVGVSSESGIRRSIELMVELDYLKETGHLNIWSIHEPDKEKPIEEEIKEIDKRLEEMEEDK